MSPASVPVLHLTDKPDPELAARVVAAAHEVGVFHVRGHGIPRGVDRFSAAFFLAPRLDAIVIPMDLPAELAARTNGLDPHSDSPVLAAYGEHALRGRLRSHPRVAERWWGAYT